jgi:hypothetical protein
MSLFRLALIAVISALPRVCLCAPKESVGYALVVTNNRSLDTSRPDLHYADDDGIQYAKLFTELVGRERVILLTEPDAGTMQLYPEWGATAIPPTRNQLDSAVARLERAVTADKRSGRHVEVYVVFAGHGDIYAGQGFFALEDSRFTADDLEENLIARLQADRIHLIIDSCNSYFMLNPRGAGVRRWSAPDTVTHGLLEKYPKVGALISTSAEAVTYEWSELQSGIFSYEVRSALRGAADADGIAGVSYAEVAAFVHVASASIANELYRPKLFMHGPGGDSRAIIMPRNKAADREISIKSSGRRRLTIRDEMGVRVLDVHKEEGTALRLNLPNGDGTLDIYETIQTTGQARPAVTVRHAAAHEGPTDLDAIGYEPSLTASRGEAPVFRDMFAKPFGRAALKTYGDESARTVEPAFGVSERDIERLEVHLRLSAKLERKRRSVIGILGLSLGSFLIANQTVAVLVSPSKGSIVLSSVGLGLAVGYVSFSTYRFIRPTELERLYDSFHSADLSTGALRAAALVRTEREWKIEVDGQKKRRRVRAYTDVIVGGLVTAGAVVYMAFIPSIVEDKDLWVYNYINFGFYGVLGMVAVGSGIWHFKNPTPLEEAWKAYLDHRNGFSPSHKQVATVNVSPAVYLNGGGLMLSGTF